MTLLASCHPLVLGTRDAPMLSCQCQDGLGQPGLWEEQVDEVWFEAKVSVLGTDQPGFFVNVFPCTLIILKKTLAANSRICL